jgi:hypothetical protein
MSDKLLRDLLDPPALLDRCRALGVLGAITAEEDDTDEDFWGYRFLPTHGGHQGRRCPQLAMYAQEYFFEVHFSEAGVLIAGHAEDSYSSFDSAYQGDGIWRRFLDQTPEALKPCQDTFDPGGSPEDPGDWFPYLTCLVWRTAGSDSWQSARVHTADGVVTSVCDKGYDAGLYQDLTAPSLDHPECVWAFDEQLEELRKSRPEGLAAVRQILELRPLTDELVRSINPGRSLADLAQSAAVREYAKSVGRR